MEKFFNNEESLFFAGFFPTKISEKKINEFNPYYNKLTQSQKDEMEEYSQRVMIFYKAVKVWARFS